MTEKAAELGLSHWLAEGLASMVKDVMGNMGEGDRRAWAWKSLGAWWVDAEAKRNVALYFNRLEAEERLARFEWERKQIERQWLFQLLWAELRRIWRRLPFAWDVLRGRIRPGDWWEDEDD